MEYLIVILTGICIILAVFYINKKAKPGRKEELEKKDPSKLKINMPGVEKPKAEKSKTAGRSQESLDALYANSHGMWVCRCCETLNDGGAIKCSACGAKK